MSTFINEIRENWRKTTSIYIYTHIYIMKDANKQFSTVYIVSTTDRLCEGSKTIDELILKCTMDDSITSTTVS